MPAVLCSIHHLPRPRHTGVSPASRASISYVSLPPSSRAVAHALGPVLLQVMQSQMIGMQSSLDRILNAIQSQGQNQNPVPSPNQNQPMVPSPYSAGPSRDSPGLGASQSRCPSRATVFNSSRPTRRTVSLPCIPTLARLRASGA